MLIFKCPECEDSTMGFNEAEEMWACGDCDHEIVAEDATKMFDDGDLIAVVESSDKDDDDDMDDKDDDKDDDDMDDKDDKKSKKEESFNGFANRDTWTVNLVVQNEYQVQKKALATIREADSDEAKEVALKAYVEDTVAKNDSFSDVFENIEFADVSWNEIVEALNEAATELDQIRTDLENALGVNEDMSDDDRTAITTVFESALTVKYNELKGSLEEKYASDLEEATKANHKELTVEMSGYLDEAIAEWMEDNKLVIEHAIRTEMTDTFMENLADLFKTHYIEVPEDRFDVLEDMADKVEEQDTKLSEAKEEISDLQNKLDGQIKEAVLAGLSDGLTDTQVEKLEELAGSIDYESEDQFKTALSTLKESFLTTNKNKKDGDVIEIDENAKNLNEINDDVDEITNPSIAQAVRGLNRVA